MKEYNKEKLHEYAKELFALCLEKGMSFNYNTRRNRIEIIRKKDIPLYTYLSEEKFNFNSGIVYCVWIAIEKVKQL